MERLLYQRRDEMSTLYISDLDGTLLKSDETTSEYTEKVINHFIENGEYFSYATARSIFTASKVVKGFIQIYQ